MNGLEEKVKRLEAELRHGQHQYEERGKSLEEAHQEIKSQGLIIDKLEEEVKTLENENISLKPTTKDDDELNDDNIRLRQMLDETE